MLCIFFPVQFNIHVDRQLRTSKRSRRHQMHVVTEGGRFSSCCHPRTFINVVLVLYESSSYAISTLDLWESILSLYVCVKSKWLSRSWKLEPCWDCPKTNWWKVVEGSQLSWDQLVTSSYIHIRSYRKREPLVDSFLSPTEGEGDWRGFGGYQP